MVHAPFLDELKVLSFASFLLQRDKIKDCTTGINFIAFDEGERNPNLGLCGFHEVDGIPVTWSLHARKIEMCKICAILNHCNYYTCAYFELIIYLSEISDVTNHCGP